jgi:hypothetical protein
MCDVLLAGVEGVSTEGNMEKKSGLRVGLGLVRERSGPLRTGKTRSCRRTENICF